MSPIIEALLLQITARCLQITAQGQWHAFLHISAHVRKIDVDIDPADTDYQSNNRPARAFAESVYFAADPRYDYSWVRASDDEAEHDLQTLLANLEPFLQADQREAVA